MPWAGCSCIWIATSPPLATARRPSRFSAQQGVGAALFDAVIMDLTIPGGMGGREAVRVRSSKSILCARVNVSSGYSDDLVPVSIVWFFNLGF